MSPNQEIMTESELEYCTEVTESSYSSERLEELEIYRLDYEAPALTTSESAADSSVSEPPFAAGGESLQPGDHVYMWCTMYQHHGIVLETNPELKSLLIAEFTNAALLEDSPSLMKSTSTASGAASVGVRGGFRIVQESEPQKWHKVKYQAHAVECLTWRPGTCSSSKASPVPLILKRVQFLKDCRHLIPDYHILASNGETVAVWCVTGEWTTLRGDRALQVSQVGGALTSLVTAGLGVAAGGLAVWHSRQIEGQWKKTAALLNKEFEWYSMGKTPGFSFQPSE